MIIRLHTPRHIPIFAKKFRLLYHFLHTTIYIWFRLYFRKMFIHGTRHIPKKGPVILACNHPNSFLDAIAVAVLIKRPIHFLVRSDVFKHPAARWIFKKLHMIPIYRLEEGAENLEKNKDTFRLCTEILSQGKVLLIFSEGNCVLEKRLRPLRKGTPRIAFGTEEAHNWQLNVKIVPVGINYAQPTQFRTDLMISMAEGFYVREYEEAWKNDPARAIRTFNERLSPALRSELLIIPDKKLDVAGETLLGLGRTRLHYAPFRALSRNVSRLREEQRWLHKVFTQEDELFIERLERFGKATRQLHIPVEAVSGKRSTGRLLLLILGYVPALAGFIIHALPGWLAFRITRKTVRDPKFRSSVLFGTGFLLSHSWYLLLAITCIFTGIRFLPVILLSPLLGWIGLLWWEAVQQTRWNVQLSLFRKKAPELFKRWKNERDALLDKLN